MYEDDREEETLQSDAETAKKVTINEASALLRAGTTLTDLQASEEKSVVIMNTPDHMTMTSVF